MPNMGQNYSDSPSSAEIYVYISDRIFSLSYDSEEEAKECFKRLAVWAQNGQGMKRVDDIDVNMPETRMYTRDGCDRSVETRFKTWFKPGSIDVLELVTSGGGEEGE